MSFFFWHTLYLYPLINKSTRVHGNKLSTIDNIYKNISHIATSVGITYLKLFFINIPYWHHSF